MQLRPDPGQLYASLLTTGQRRVQTLCQMQGIKVMQARSGKLEVFVAMRVAAQQHDLERTEGKIQVRVLCQYGSMARQLKCCELREVLFAQQHLAVCGFDVSSQRVQQGGFARAVWSNQGQYLAWSDLK
jgi:hypothetical protein